MWGAVSADKADTLVKELDIEPTGGDKDGYPLKWRARGTYRRRVQGVLTYSRCFTEKVIADVENARVDMTADEGVLCLVCRRNACDSCTAQTEQAGEDYEFTR